MRFVVPEVAGDESAIDELFGIVGYRRLPTRRRQYVSQRGGEGQRFHAFVLEAGRYRRGAMIDYEVRLHLDCHGHASVSSRGRRIIHEEREKVQRFWRRHIRPG